MKKLITLFLITYIFSYANYLTTNSEIVLFYDKEYNSIKYIRGDVFNKIDISRIEGNIILDNNRVISLNDHFVKSDYLLQSNILKINYNIYGNEIVLNVIPSMYERDKLYFIVEFLNSFSKVKKIDFAFRIIPQKENHYIDFNKKNMSYSYDDFYFKSENYLGKAYLARDKVIEEFSLEEIKGKLKKYQDDSLYYIIKDVDANNTLNFTIKFYSDFDDKLSIDPNLILCREVNYWNQNKNEFEYDDKKEIFKKELQNLEIMTSRSVIPDKIDYNKSEENLNNKIKLYYLNSIYNKNFDVNKFFEDINIRKSENEAVVYYTFLFKYLNETGKYLTGDLLEKKIIPEVLSLLDYLEEIDDEVINVRNNIKNYYWYYKLIINIEERKEFQSEKEFIEGKKVFLLNYLRKNYVLEDGLKVRKQSKESYYKNIKYIDFLSSEEQRKILKEEYNKYYSDLFGVLKREKLDNKIDIDYNLNFIIKLYENNETYLADKLFFNLKNYIKKNQFYMPKNIYLNENNIPKIDGETLYLYFMAERYKEKNGD